MISIARRQANRMRHFDYSSAGFYFVTICIKNRGNILGKVNSSNKIELSEFGKISDECWRKIPFHFEFATIDEFEIMPNHIHGIIKIDQRVGNADLRSLLKGKEQDRTKMRLAKIIHAFKSTVSRDIHRLFPDELFAWQKSYYDHIIHYRKELTDVREYIRLNPYNWKEDPENKRGAKNESD